MSSFYVRPTGCWARFYRYQYKHKIMQFVQMQVYKDKISMQGDAGINSRGGSEFQESSLLKAEGRVERGYKEIRKDSFEQW